MTQCSLVDMFQKNLLFPSSEEKNKLHGEKWYRYREGKGETNKDELLYSKGLFYGRQMLKAKTLEYIRGRKVHKRKKNYILIELHGVKWSIVVWRVI